MTSFTEPPEHVFELLESTRNMPPSLQTCAKCYLFRRHSCHAPKASVKEKCCFYCDKKMTFRDCADCPCHTPSSGESWEGRWNEFYETKWLETRNGHSCIGRITLRDELTSFIQKEKDESFKVGLDIGFKEGRAEGKSLCLKEVREKVEEMMLKFGEPSKFGNRELDGLYNHALDALLSALSDMGEEIIK